MRITSLAVAAILALVPASGVPVGAQSGDTEFAPERTAMVTFYGHVFGHGLGEPMPANTEKPIGEDNYGLGSFAYCTNAGVVFGTCEETTANKLALFTTAGFVDVENRAQFEQEGGYAQLHNERGQTKDIQLDPNEPVGAGIFLTVDLHSWPVSNAHGTNCLYPHPQDVPCLYPYWGWDPGVQQDFVVTAKLYSAPLGEHGANASDAPPVEAAIAAGDATLIAEGQFGPELVMNGLPGSPNVNEYVIDLGPPQVETVPRSHDLFLVYSFYSDSGAVQYGYHTWRIWAGEFFPPTFTLPVNNAFDVERVIPNFAHGRLAILGILNTPWGSYDIDPKSVELTVEGPNGVVAPSHLAKFADFSVAHGGHYLPVNVTWVWDYAREDLRPGDYTITVSGKNHQHSAEASCTATFTLRRAGSGDALRPGDVQEGLCGEQTASQALVDELKRGATQGG